MMQGEPYIVLEVLHLLFPFSVMWAYMKLRTHCFGCNSQSYLTEMVELGNAFCVGWEDQAGDSTFQQISISETCEDEKQYFPGCPGLLKTSDDIWWQAGHFLPQLPAILTTEPYRLLAPSSGLLYMTGTFLTVPGITTEMPKSPTWKRNSRKVSLLSYSTDTAAREQSFWKELQKQRGLPWQHVKGSIFPVSFMSLHKKEIRNWILHSLPFINVSVMCTLCCRLMMQFPSKINCCFRQPSIFYDCKTISLLKMKVTFPKGWAVFNISRVCRVGRWE